MANDTDGLISDAHVPKGIKGAQPAPMAQAVAVLPPMRSGQTLSFPTLAMPASTTGTWCYVLVHLLASSFQSFTSIWTPSNNQSRSPCMQIELCQSSGICLG